MRISKSILFLLVLVLATSAGAFAQSGNAADSADAASVTQAQDTLTLTGYVPQKVSIEVAETGDYNNLDLTADITDSVVATVTETSNVAAGYTVTIEPQNALVDGSAVLVGGQGDENNHTDDAFAYSLKYDGTPIDFSGGSQVTISDVADRTDKDGVDKDLAISYSYSGQTVNLYDGIYTDTLTFTINAK